MKVSATVNSFSKTQTPSFVSSVVWFVVTNRSAVVSSFSKATTSVVVDSFVWLSKTNKSAVVSSLVWLLETNRAAVVSSFFLFSAPEFIGNAFPEKRLSGF